MELSNIFTLQFRNEQQFDFSQGYAAPLEDDVATYHFAGLAGLEECSHAECHFDFPRPYYYTFSAPGHVVRFWKRGNGDLTRIL